jgi:hypothetical protein
MAKFVNMLNRVGVAHPPKYFFRSSIIGQHFNIGRGPTAAANNCYLVFLHLHPQIKMSCLENCFSRQDKYIRLDTRFQIAGARFIFTRANC